MKSVCEQCPHRKVSEGGIIKDDECMTVVHGHDTQYHPCHMQTDVACRGNIRQVKEREAGVKCIDRLVLTQVLHGVEFKP